MTHAMTRPDAATVTPDEAAMLVGADALWAAVQQHAAANKDAIVDTRALTARVIPVPTDDDAPLPPLVVDAATPDGALGLVFNEHAERQLAARVDIPLKYWDRMRRSDPDLLATNVNRWLHTEPAKQMLRLRAPVTDAHRERLAAADGHLIARAVLTNRYEARDNLPLLRMVLPVAAALGVALDSWGVDDDGVEFHARFTSPERTIADVRAEYAARHHMTVEQVAHHARTADGKDVSWVNETLAFGAAIRNSETGNGSLAVSGFAKILRCLNALVIPAAERVVHVGRRKEEGVVRADTARVEEAAVWLRVRDRFEDALSAERLAATATAIVNGQREPLLLPAETSLFGFIDTTAAYFQFTEAEADVLKEEVTRERLYRDGRLDRWTLSQAMTATARRVAGTDPHAVTPRRVELETAGWEILDDANLTAKLVAAAGAAVK